MKQDLISVIIPMYKVEKFIEKCLESVCKSTYKNLEIICVDDASPDNSAKIAMEFAKKDNRIKIIKNPENFGLFRARVEGMKVATGDYIAFVDSDDFVSLDWFRLLHKKITEEKADMVLGNTVNVDEHLYFSYFNNYRTLTSSHATLYGEDVLDTLLKQEGSCFMWHTVWNKLYSKKLVDECMPYFKKIGFHLIMCEDIAFSSVFYTHAKSLAFADADAYFYYRHSEASTSTTLPIEKILKNIKDIKNVFDFFENSLKSYNKEIFEKNKEHIKEFKEKYHRNWAGFIYDTKQNDAIAKNVLKETFGTDKECHPLPHDNYFCELSTPWSNRYEYIKSQIIEKNIKVISFDIFDTLLVRPFYIPDDIFYFVGKFAHKLIPEINEQNFVDMRRQAESQARAVLSITKPMQEDATLTEIYNLFTQLFGIDKNIADKIKEEEKRLEIKFCKARSTAKELFELAICSGKKVVLTSDMYLEKDTLEAMLAKNGYKGYDKLYLSSDKRLLKSTGHLYEVMIKDVGVKPEEIIHLGDNWNVDNISAHSKGIKTIFLPKTLETFENKISDIFVGDAMNSYLANRHSVMNETSLIKDIGLRSMLAMTANKLFDNPFKPIQRESNYNASAYLTGYYTLGMHMFGVANWILKTAKQMGYKKIVFLARDGYLAKQVFDYINEKTGAGIESEYFYASRKALMPYSIKTKNDLLGLYEYININSGAHSPRSIIKMLSAVLKPLIDADEKKYADEGIILDKKLTSNKDFFNFVKALGKISFDEKLCKEKRNELKRYFDKVFPAHTATFDVGYSGRLQSIICDLSDKQVDTFFIHSNGYTSNVQANGKFNIHSFYDFTPSMSSIVREFLISKPEPSCIGYKIENNKLTPVFEDKHFSYEETYAINEFQKGAYHFAKDYTDMFSDYLDEMSFRNIDVSFPFDFYLLNASQFDRYTFSAAMVEDFVYSGYNSQSIFGIWTCLLNNLLAQHSYHRESPVIVNENNVITNYLSRYSRLKRALFYYLFDRKTFKAKMKNRKKNKKNKKK